MKMIPALLVLLAVSTFGQSQAPPVPSNSQKSCLVVAGSSGNNKAIAYYFLGVAGLLMSGDRYEYRDSANVDGQFLKPKYKGKDLAKAMKDGVHVIVVNRKNSTPEEVATALHACEAQ